MAGEKRRNLRGLNLGFVIVILALLVAIVILVKNIIGLHIEQNELKAQEQALSEKRDELTEELKNVDDLEYIEEQARKLLRMIKPGEVLFITDDSGSATNNQAGEAADTESDSEDTSDSEDAESSDDDN